MKVSTLLFQTTALVGAVGFSSAQVVPPPRPPDVKATPAPAFQLPESEFGQVLDVALKAAINPTDYQCELGGVYAYINSLYSGIENVDEFNSLRENWDLTSWPYYYSLSFDYDDTDDVFGQSKQQMVEFKERFRQMKGFWDVDMDDVLLKDFNGQVIADTEKMVAMLQAIFYQDCAPVTEIRARAVVAYAKF